VEIEAKFFGVKEAMFPPPPPFVPTATPMFPLVPPPSVPAAPVAIVDGETPSPPLQPFIPAAPMRVTLGSGYPAYATVTQNSDKVWSMSFRLFGTAPMVRAVCVCMSCGYGHADGHTRHGIHRFTDDRAVDDAQPKCTSEVTCPKCGKW
jgi:hypothetical protein